MDILAAYREAGSYRGAAVICGTTHKTVKRVVERHNAGGAEPARKDCSSNYDGIRRLVAEVKAAWRRGHHRGRRPATWTPGGAWLRCQWCPAQCCCSG